MSRPRFHFQSPLWVILPPLFFALWVYLPVLRLPNMYDTLLHTQLADNLTFWNVWLPQEGFGFYRPLVFLPLVALRALLDGYPAPLLQGLNLLQHALNAALLAGLLWRLDGRRWPALAAGLFLAGLPYGYQAVAIYGNNAYLTVSGLLLIGGHLWLSRPPRLGALLALLQLLALLVHETGALLLPLIVVLSLAERWTGRGRRWRAADLWPAVFVLLLYLAAYPFLPRGGGPQLDFGGNETGPKLLLFIQALVYPVAWLWRFLPAESAAAVLLGGLALVVVWGGWLWWRRPAARPLLLTGLTLWLLPALLVGGTLPTYYIADGARLLYPGGLGAAVLWAGLLVGGGYSVKKRQYSVVSGQDSVRSGRDYVGSGGDWGVNVVRVVLVAAVLLPGVGFARQMIGYYGRVGEPLGPLAAVLRDAPAGDGVVWVNPPQWVAPPARSYPFGTELAPLLGIHLFAAELLEANGLGNRPVAVLDAPGLRGEAPFPYGLYELTSVDQLDPAGLPAETSHVFITAYGEEGLATRYTGRLSGAGGRTPAAAAALGPFQLERAGAYACEAGLVVELVLLTAESPAPTLSLFVQALAADGRLLAQADGPPLGIPPGRLVWSPGLELVDSRLLPAGPDAAAELLVGAYDFTTGERLPAVDAAGRALPDSGVRLPVAGCLFPVGD